MPVLPFCILNVIIAYLVTLAKKYAIYITFSSQVHASMGLLVSFLVLNKLYLALDRYMLLRGLLGTACSSLRELHQCALVFTTRQSSKNKHKNSDDLMQRTHRSGDKEYEIKSQTSSRVPSVC